MDTDKLLEYFSHVANVSLNQTKMLFKLCDNDFEKLMELEAKRKKHWLIEKPRGVMPELRGCPYDKESVDAILALKFKKEDDEEN